MEKFIVTENITREVIQTGIIRYILAYPEVDDFSVLSADIRRICEDWREDHLLRLVIDMRHMTLSPYSHQQIEQIRQSLWRQLDVDMAIILPKSVMGNLISHLADRTATHIHANHHIRCFYTYTDALEWLTESLSAPA